jgi:TonB-dependent receptor
VITSILVFINLNAMAQSTVLSGKIIDKSTKEPLPGANILIEGTSMGTISNVNGEYIIRNLRSGKYNLIVSFIGYSNLKQEVEVLINQRNEINFEMITNTILGEEIVVTAQAQGQMQAINQQMSALTITNIVSKNQIQELPESNAAEAVGRLPGVSLERNGGEGTKVVIRGMQPKYTKVQVDGINMAATGGEDRSVDLSMISPYMLEGIELTKSVMANQDATATGGIVNFIIKEAPKEPMFSIIAQGGYNNLENRYSDYKFAFGGSNRFFNNQLGAFAQFNIEQKDASSDQMGGIEYDYENSRVLTREMYLKDINRKIKRYGATIVLDFALPLTKIKLTSFASRINRDEQQFGIAYRYHENQFGRSLNDIPNNQLSVMTNSLKLEKTFGGFQIGTSLSYAFSFNETPEAIQQEIGYIGINKPFGNLLSTYFIDLDPYSIPDSIKYTDAELVKEMNFGDMTHEESFSKETEFAYELNVSYDFNPIKNLNIKLEIGGKYALKKVLYEQENYIIHFDWGGSQPMKFRDAIIDYYWDQLSDYNRSLKGQLANDFRFSDFVDTNYTENDFLNNKYDFGSVPSLEMFRKIDDLGREQDLYYYDNVNSKVYDFYGNEKFYAFYFMPKIKIANKLTLIPGVRYESNRTDYTGYRGNLLGISFPWNPFYPDTASYVRENDFFLPMMQLFYKPTKWLNIKAGYTHTLQRPDYVDIIPGYLRDRSYIEWHNFKLRPEKAKNIDLQASIFSSKVGLISLGVFHKKISDMIFYTGDKVITEPDDYELPAATRFAHIDYMTNNEYDVFNYGYEFEWQSNFYYLPGILKGIVCNLNYTRNISEAKYLRTIIKTEYDENFQPIFTNIDTSYTNPMIMQPDYLFNLTLGFDYKGFSIRGATRFSSHIFKTANWHEELRGYSTNFFRFDLALRQKMPLDGLELFLNINNITNEYERDIIHYKSFTNYHESYGGSLILGIRYQFLKKKEMDEAKD